MKSVFAWWPLRSPGNFPGITAVIPSCRFPALFHTVFRRLRSGERAEASQRAFPSRERASKQAKTRGIIVRTVHGHARLFLLTSLTAAIAGFGSGASAQDGAALE